MTVAEALNSKPPLGAALAQGVRTLSMDQEISFSLYQRYVFPLDGMTYWIKVQSDTLTTAGVQAIPGLATMTDDGGAAIQVAPAGAWTQRVLGGVIANPLTAADQGLPTTFVAESLFYDFTGPAYSYVTATTAELKPGEQVDIPAECTNGAWVCSPSDNHKFTCVIYVEVPSVTLPVDVVVQGSLHYNSTSEQREDATVDTNEIIFTSLQEIQSFNQIGPNHLYIGSYRDMLFAFSSRGRLYEQSDLYHYAGKALFSKHKTQIIDDPSTFNPKLVVSNSLPIWLSMSSYVPPYPTFDCPFPLYPSYLVDDNLPPPFGAVHVEETKALAMAPVIGPRTQTAYLCRDKVTIHLYGLDQEQADNFFLFVEQYSRDWGTIGFASSPSLYDVKHQQTEMRILAQRKAITYEVNYLQSVARDIARQFILHAKVQIGQQFLAPDVPSILVPEGFQENAFQNNAFQAAGMVGEVARRRHTLRH